MHSLIQSLPYIFFTYLLL